MYLHRKWRSWEHMNCTFWSCTSWFFFAQEYIWIRISRSSVKAEVSHLRSSTIFYKAFFYLFSYLLHVTLSRLLNFSISVVFLKTFIHTYSWHFASMSRDRYSLNFRNVLLSGNYFSTSVIICFFLRKFFMTASEHFVAQISFRV